MRVFASMAGEIQMYEWSCRRRATEGRPHAHVLVSGHNEHLSDIGGLRRYCEEAGIPEGTISAAERYWTRLSEKR